MTKKIAINIIMGFLGVGKTTAILNLLKNKPVDEHWAVLVNEFGEVGIDGAILSAQSGMTISEVPGGCLCCVSGIPFQVALSNLIAQQKPDRILIEPTGLGHPKNLIRSLTTKEYQVYSELKASICLLDPRQLKNPRYQQHETFNDQCFLADVLVANKTDLASEIDENNFYQFAKNMQPQKSKLGWVNNGQLDLTWLDIDRDDSRHSKGAHPIHSHSNDDVAEDVMEPVSLADGQSYKAFENRGMGYYSLGWLLAEDQVFDHQVLTQWLMMLDVERVKGLLITDQGTRVMNLRDQVFSEMPTRSLSQSRIEIIHNQVLDKIQLEAGLLACLIA
ncbi:MAG: GTP-binding protein [Oleispira sp.]|nr:GTP-binding protein [Oleispira sp.]